MKPLGRRRWLLPGGCMPSRGSGPEPAFTSHDLLCLLNCGDELANVRVRALYGDREPIGPFRLGVAARRVRHVRVNDLIFPQALPLDVGYGLEILSDVPVVVQFSRADTRQRALSLLSTIGWGQD
jgi:hypothetical protein